MLNTSVTSLSGQGQYGAELDPTQQHPAPNYAAKHYSA